MRKSIILLLVCALLPVSAAWAEGFSPDAWDFYVTGPASFDAVVRAFTTVANVFSNNQYVALFYCVIVGSIFFGGLSVFAKLSFGGKASIVGWFATGIVGVILYFALIVPKSTAFIYDPVSNQQMSVGGIPYVISMTAGIFNRIERGVIDIISDSGDPSGFQQSGGGIGFLGLKRLIGLDGPLPSDNFMQSIDYYIKDCVVFELKRPGTTLTVDGIMKGTEDLSSIVLAGASPAVPTTYFEKDGKRVSDKNCDEAAKYITDVYISPAGIKKETDALLASVCSSLGFVAPVINNGNLASSLQSMSASANVASMYCIQSINNTVAAMGMSPIDLGLLGMTSAAMSLFDQLAQMNMSGSSYQVTGNTMAKQSQGMINYVITLAPVLKGMLMAISLIMVPITALLLPTAIFGRVLAFTASGFLTLSLWNVIDAGLHGFLMSYVNSMFENVRRGNYGFETMMYFMPDATSQAYNTLAGMTMGGFAMASAMSAAIFKMGGGVVSQIATDSIGVGRRDAIQAEHGKWDGTRQKEAAFASGESMMIKEGMAQGMTAADMTRKRAIAQGSSASFDAFSSMKRAETNRALAGDNWASKLGGAAGTMKAVSDQASAVTAKEIESGVGLPAAIQGKGKADAATMDKQAKVFKDTDVSTVGSAGASKELGGVNLWSQAQAAAKKLGVNDDTFNKVIASNVNASKAVAFFQGVESYNKAHPQSQITGGAVGDVFFQSQSAQEAGGIASHLKMAGFYGGDASTGTQHIAEIKTGTEAGNADQMGTPEQSYLVSAVQTAGVVAGANTIGTTDKAAALATQDTSKRLATYQQEVAQATGFLNREGHGKNPMLVDQKTGVATTAGMAVANLAAAGASLRAMAGSNGMNWRETRNTSGVVTGSDVSGKVAAGDKAMHEQIAAWADKMGAHNFAKAVRSGHLGKSGFDFEGKFDSAGKLVQGRAMGGGEGSWSDIRSWDTRTMGRSGSNVVAEDIHKKVHDHMDESSDGTTTRNGHFVDVVKDGARTTGVVDEKGNLLVGESNATITRTSVVDPGGGSPLVVERKVGDQSVSNVAASWDGSHKRDVTTTNRDGVSNVNVGDLAGSLSNSQFKSGESAAGPGALSDVTALGRGALKETTGIVSDVMGARAAAGMGAGKGPVLQSPVKTTTTTNMGTGQTTTAATGLQKPWGSSSSGRSPTAPAASHAPSGGGPNKSAPVNMGSGGSGRVADNAVSSGPVGTTTVTPGGGTPRPVNINHSGGGGLADNAAVSSGPIGTTTITPGRSPRPVNVNYGSTTPQAAPSNGGLGRL